MIIRIVTTEGPQVLEWGLVGPGAVPGAGLGSCWVVERSGGFQRRVLGDSESRVLWDLLGAQGGGSLPAGECMKLSVSQQTGPVQTNRIAAALPYYEVLSGNGPVPFD